MLPHLCFSVPALVGTARPARLAARVAHPGHAALVWHPALRVCRPHGVRCVGHAPRCAEQEAAAELYDWICCLRATAVLTTPSVNAHEPSHVHPGHALAD